MPRYKIRVIDNGQITEISSSSYMYARKLFLFYVNGAITGKKEDYNVLLMIDESVVARYHAPREVIDNG